MIITYFLTFLCIKDNILYQSNFCDFAENKPYIASTNDIINLGYNIIQMGEGGTVGFAQGSSFLSALPNRTFSHGENLLAWEIFRVLDTYQPFQISPLPQNKAIPHIIHQTDSTDTPREQFFGNIKELRTLNEEFIYKYYNEKDRHDFIYENFGWNILKRFLRINPRYGAASADLFRYLCIYKSGGVYLDMKSGCHHPFRNLIRPTDEILLSHWDSKKTAQYHGWGRGIDIEYIPHGEYQQWFIISRAGNKLLEKVINQVISNIDMYDEAFDDIGRAATLRITGPYAFTRAIEPHAHYNNVRMIDAELEGIIYNNVPEYTKIHNYKTQKLPLIL